MGILTRFKEIMSSNVNAILDKMEDPEKMIDQCLRNLNSDLAKIKSETAAVMAEETRSKREYDECKADIEKYQSYAVKAVQAGNDDDAKKFLEKKNQLSQRLSELEQIYQNAHTNAENMKKLHSKLVSDIEQLEERRTAAKSKLAAAKAQEKINNMMSSVGDSNRSISAFEKMEQKADKMLDKANAMAELNSGGNSLKDLERKYDSGYNADDELAALKESMGK